MFIDNTVGATILEDQVGARKPCRQHSPLSEEKSGGEKVHFIASLSPNYRHVSEKKIKKRMCAGSHQTARESGSGQRPSLVVCPQVLVGHWVFEIEKYVDTSVLRTVPYEGSPSHRHSVRTAGFQKADIIVMSYETLRSDIEHLQDMRWLYCILDEGHLIRNPKSKLNQVWQSPIYICIGSLYFDTQLNCPLSFCPCPNMHVDSF